MWVCRRVEVLVLFSFAESCSWRERLERKQNGLLPGRYLFKGRGIAVNSRCEPANCRGCFEPAELSATFCLRDSRARYFLFQLFLEHKEEKGRQ